MRYIYVGKSGNVTIGKEKKYLTRGQIFQFNGELNDSKFVPIIENCDKCPPCEEQCVEHFSNEKAMTEESDGVEDKMMVKEEAKNKSYKPKFKRAKEA